MPRKPLTGPALASYEDEIQKTYLQAEQDSASEYLRNLTTPATGALALSITFIEKIGGQASKYRGVLATSWTAFVVTIFCVLVLYQARSMNLRSIRRFLRGDDPEPSKWLGPAAKVLRWVALVSFVTGTAALAIFGYLNLPPG